MSEQCNFWLDLNIDQVVKWPRHLLPGAPPINHIVRCTLEPGHEGDHDFFRDGVEIACDAFAPVRNQTNANGRHCFTDFKDIDSAHVTVSLSSAAMRECVRVFIEPHERYREPQPTPSGIVHPALRPTSLHLCRCMASELRDALNRAFAEYGSTLEQVGSCRHSDGEVERACRCRCHKLNRFWADWCDDCATRHDKDLSEMARIELVQLWGDMAWALREAANGKWSIRMESLAHRIGRLSRLVGVAPWTTVETSLLRKEVYQKVHNDAGLEFPPIDWERVAEVERKIG